MDPVSAIRDVARRALLACSRAVLRLTDDETALQSVQVEALAGEVLNQVEHLQPYGLSSHAPRGSDVVIVALGGQRQHSIALVATDRDKRPIGLPEGDVVLYGPDDVEDPYHRVHFMAGHVIELRSKTTVLRLEPKGMTLTTPSGTQTWGTA